MESQQVDVSKVVSESEGRGEAYAREYTRVRSHSRPMPTCHALLLTVLGVGLVGALRHGHEKNAVAKSACQNHVCSF
jgi:hypothetical protein